MPKENLDWLVAADRAARDVGRTLDKPTLAFLGLTSMMMGMAPFARGASLRFPSRQPGWFAEIEHLLEVGGHEAYGVSVAQQASRGVQWGISVTVDNEVYRDGQRSRALRTFHKSCLERVRLTNTPQAVVAWFAAGTIYSGHQQLARITRDKLDKLLDAELRAATAAVPVAAVTLAVGDLMLDLGYLNGSCDERALESLRLSLERLRLEVAVLESASRQTPAFGL